MPAVLLAGFFFHINNDKKMEFDQVNFGH